MGSASYGAYLDYLETHPGERDALLEVILINVTSFFRDRALWDELSIRVVPALVARVAGQRQIRVWSVGCASGEEAYSIAMLFADAVGLERCAETVRIFATDIDGDAVWQARMAHYDAAAIKDIDPGTLAAYFDSVDGGFKVKRELRKAVVVGQHDILKDPPIANIDLILCRNLLIYLDAARQKEVFQRFQFSLAAGANLVLGKAETLLADSPEFETVDSRNRIFRKIGQKRSAKEAQFWSVAVSGTEPEGLPAALLAGALNGLRSAQILLDAEDQVALANGVARTWFALTRTDIGRPFRDLDVSFRPLELRSLIEQARASHGNIVRDEIEWTPVSGEKHILRCQVVPISDRYGQHVGTSISFHDMSELVGLRASLTETIRVLEKTTDDLQAVNEELETTNEELQSSNEELETLNEELQATNEELETTNEELRASNDRLGMANDQLTIRTDQLTSYRTSMEALLSGLHMSVIGVDRDGRVTFWNAESERIWGMRPEDAMGQSLFEIGPLRGLVMHRAKIEAVASGLSDWAIMEFTPDVRVAGKSICRVCMVPSRSLGHDADGALLLVEDISEQLQLQATTRQAGRYSQALLEAIDEALIVLDMDLDVVDVNLAARNLLGLGKAAVSGVPLSDLAGGLLGRAPFRDAFACLTPFVSSTERFVVESEDDEDRRRTWSFRATKMFYGEVSTSRILLSIRVCDH